MLNTCAFHENSDPVSGIRQVRHPVHPNKFNVDDLQKVDAERSNDDVISGLRQFPWRPDARLAILVQFKNANKSEAIGVSKRHTERHY
jgi:hypothetical protein